MKKIIFILLLAPLFSLGQEKLSLKNVLNISDKDSFLKQVIENGYSEGNSTKDKIYHNFDANESGLFNTISSSYIF